MNKISILETNIFFLIFMLGYISLAILVGGALPADCPEWLAFCVNDAVVIAPIAVILICKKAKLGEILRLERIGVRDVIVTYVGAYTLLPMISFLNVLTMLFAKNHVNDMVLDIYNYPLWLQLLIIAVLPALVEEFVFRGFFYGSYRRRNVLGGALMSGLFFGLMHMNINQFAYAFVIGVVFCLLYEATGNFFIPVVAHFAINANTIFTLAFSGVESQEITQSASVGIADSMPLPAMIIVLSVIFAVGVVGVVIFGWLLSLLAKWHGREGFLKKDIRVFNDEQDGKFIDKTFWMAVVPLVIYMIMLEMQI